MRALSASFALLALLSSDALATDYYVDVVNGSDAAAGTSPATAWKTLTFASTNAATGNFNTIHVAPGTYSSASGEVLPLQFRDQNVVGDQGAATTILDGGGALAVVRLLNSPQSTVPYSVASLRGFTLQNALRGIEVAWSWSSVAPTFTDLVVRNATIGVGAYSSSFSGAGAFYDIQLARVRSENCAIGLSLGGGSGFNLVNATDCSFVNNTQRGLDCLMANTLTARFDRCTFTGNAVGGARASASGLGHITIATFDCLFANNPRGFSAETFGTGFVSSSLTRCTIANNAVSGIETTGAGLLIPSFTLDSVLAFGNGLDYSSPNPPSAAFSQIGGPNPLFRDPVNGDFRVYFGSPVIDAGNPTTAIGTLDLNGVARSVDGDLDTLERADIGCFEFRPLDIDTTGQQGTLLELEIFGPAGGSSSMWLGRGAFGAPVATAFGEFDMNAIANFPWVTFPVAPGPGFLFQRTIPTAPIFIGQTYSFQGLVTSAASPSGAAWSNAVSFTIGP